MLMPQTQITQITSYLDQYEPTFAENVQRTFAKIQLGGKDQDYMNAIEVYAKASPHSPGECVAHPLSQWAQGCPDLAQMGGPMS